MLYKEQCFDVKELVTIYSGFDEIFKSITIFHAFFYFGMEARPTFHWMFYATNKCAQARLPRIQYSLNRWENRRFANPSDFLSRSSDVRGLTVARLNRALCGLTYDR
jgi:hypothetical protein